MKKYFLTLFITLGLAMLSSAQTLDDYFKIAAKNNPGLQGKYLAFEVALQKAAQMGSLPDPSISFGVFISPVETRVGPQRARISLSQMFPWFGTLKAQETVATYMAEAKYQEFIDARNKLYYQVSAAYYPLYQLEKFMEIERENQRILATYKAIATVKNENGKGSMVDLLRVDLMLKESTTELTILEQKKKPLELRFNILLNRKENEVILVSDTLNIPELELDYRKDSLLAANPLLAEIDLKVKAALAQEEAAIKQGLPKIGVGLDYVFVEKREAMVFEDNGKDALMPMLTVSLPIYRKKYKASRLEAEKMQEMYTLQKQEMTNMLLSSYEMTWFKTQMQSEMIHLYEAQIAEAGQSLTLLYSAYGNSGSGFEEVLRMQQQLLKYQKMKATALAEYHIAIAELDYITAKSK